jgi:hypothetical protein
VAQDGAVSRALLPVLALLALTGCGDDPAPAGPRTVDVTAVDGGCQSTASELPTGETRFRVVNQRAEEVLFRVVYGSGSLASATVPPGEAAVVTAVLKAGELGLACGAERAPLTVAGPPR